MFNRNDSKYDQVDQDARRLAKSISELMSDQKGGDNNQKSDRMREMVDSSKQKLRDASEYTRLKGQEADRFAHENVWTTVGIAAGVGALVGMVITKMMKK